MSRIYMNSFDDWGVGQYRAKLPVLNCYSDLGKSGVSLHLERELHSDESYYDAFILHRVPAENAVFLMQTAQKNGAKFVLDVDDDILAIPDWMPSEEYKASKWAYKKCIEMADQIWTSTEELATAIGKPEKTRVLPNLIDFNTFLKPAEPRTEPVRILWTGSMWHDKDLNQIVNPVKRILKEYGTKVQFLFWGCLPTEFADFDRVPGQNIAVLNQKKEFGTSILYLSGIPFRFYYDRLVKLNGYIGLAPLCECNFNKSKSNVKYLEYSMAGMPTIASKCEPYKCIEDGVDGLLVDIDDEDGWYNAIKRLIDDRKLHDTLVSNARTKTFELHSWQSQSRKETWINAFKSLAR